MVAIPSFVSPPPIMMNKNSNGLRKECGTAEVGAKERDMQPSKERRQERLQRFEGSHGISKRRML